MQQPKDAAEGNSPPSTGYVKPALGNLRNGSNAGACYVNCRNGLGDANWNYGSCENCGKSLQARANIKYGFYVEQKLPWNNTTDLRLATARHVRKVRPYIPKAGLVRNENPE